MINGNEYAWEDVQVLIPGKLIPIDGVAAIEYDESKDHTEVYGRGSKPVALGRGKTSFSGSMTLLQSEFEALQASLPVGKSVTQMTPFNVTVAYAPAGGVATVDQLVAVRIKKFKKGGKSGDDHMEVVCDLAIGDILYNV